MKHKIFRILAWFYIALGLTCNQWVLGWLVSSNGRIDEPSSKVIIGLFDLCLIVFGILTLKKNGTELIENLNLLLWTVIITTPLVGEITIRTGIALNIEQFKSPSLYADSDVDDDFWILQRKWKGWKDATFTDRNGPLFRESQRVHPLLGWSEENITADNPLGLQENALKQIGSSAPKILFYGDSFVKGVSDKEFQIPEYMNSHIGSIDVLDLGVSGYGLDQIYLLFKETYRKFADRSLILVGILLEDSSRDLVTVRTIQKPYFIVDAAGDLQLKGVPIEHDQEKYFQSHPPGIKSYFLAFIRRKLSLANKKVDLEKQLASKLLDSFKLDTDDANDKLLVVLFYTKTDLMATNWREGFFKGKLDQMGVPYIDTKVFLLQHARENHLELKSFYKQGNCHHNNLGNRIISEGIIEYLRINNYIKGD